MIFFFFFYVCTNSNGFRVDLFRSSYLHQIWVVNHFIKKKKRKEELSNAIVKPHLSGGISNRRIPKTLERTKKNRPSNNPNAKIWIKTLQIEKIGPQVTQMQKPWLKYYKCKN